MGRYTREVEDINAKRRPSAVTSSPVESSQSGPRVGETLQMQQVIGNRHVRRVMAGGRSEPAARRPGAGSGGAGLPAPLRAQIEGMSGESLADVRIHYDSPNPARLDALAYTKGSEIHMGPGQERHLPHEAWHVVQQKQGRVQPTMRAGAQLVNDDAALEREADTMGERASSPQVPPGVLAPGRARTAAAPGRPVIQRLSVDRPARNGTQIQLRHTKWAREWTLSLQDHDGEGPALCSILFKLVTSFKGALPKLSVDTMQARSQSKGTGTELMSSIPWAIEQIISHNPLATRFGKVQLHSGFANIVAYQMTVKKYAEALELRNNAEWERRETEAIAAMGVDEEVVDHEAHSHAEHETEPTPLVPPRKIKDKSYDMSRFPQMWADTHVLIGSGLFTIDAGLMDLSSAETTVAKLGRMSKLLIDSFGASIDVNDLSELSSQIEELKSQVAQALEVSETRDEHVEY